MTQRRDASGSACHVALVSFMVGTTSVAIEARHVIQMSDAATASRTRDAATLLSQAPVADSATRWLTLHDAAGPWQLSVSGEITLAQLSVNDIFTLPPLVAARHSNQALCGMAWQAQTLTLLFDGARLSPSSP